MLSGCQHETMKNMITERHNIATRLIAKAISKGDYGGSIIYTDVASDLKLTEQNLTRTKHTANKTLPSWLLPYLLNTELARASRPDIILALPTGSNHTPHVHVQDLPPSNWDVHLIEFKYCDDTWPESQLQKAEEQNRRLVAILKAQGCSKVSLHVVLMGVMGTIHRSHTDTPLSKLGLDYGKAKKLTKDLNTHSIHYDGCQF